MEKANRVNVWFDRPGDFLEIGWRSGWSIDGFTPADAEFGIEVHLTAENQAFGLYILGTLLFADRCKGQSMVVAEVQPHPLTVKYDRAGDLWDVQWGPGAVECVDTPNPRIKARVDASGDIQGVLIADLRTFEDEILNQDIYPVKPGVVTSQGGLT